jgi:predicted nucleotidyltransferase
MGNKQTQRIKSFIEDIREHHDIQEAIFFGSRSDETHLKRSDYDVILIIEDFDGRLPERAKPFYDVWDEDEDIDIFCYTPEEFEKNKEQVGVVQEADKTGVKL